MRALRTEHERIVADGSLRGGAFGRAASALVDRTLVEAAGALPANGWALVALGSYARGELCPRSDVDVMLLHDGSSGARGTRLADDAAKLWYPLWDAGFVLGHSIRTVRESLALADQELDALTAFLDCRLVAGEGALLDDLVERVRRLAPKRRARLVEALSAGSRARFDRPGPVAEMLEPDLKDGAGGLRDVQAPGWVGWALEPGAAPAAGGWAGGVGILLERGYLRPEDPGVLGAARDRLLDARVALHRTTGARSDRLALQDQDAVARRVGASDADTLVRDLARAGRAIVWITSDLWSRLLATERGPRSRASGTRSVGDGLAVRDGRLALVADTPIDATVVLRVAAEAAAQRVPIDRDTLERLGRLRDVAWTDDARATFVRLLAAGRSAVAVFEALEHVGVLERLLPEWEHVRALPQRNAYHRFTVDRHLLEAVAECAALLDRDAPAGKGFDGDVARRARADLLLLAALLHDVAKGHPADHSELGAEVARDVARRIGLDDEGIETLVWLVAHHLLLADTATRRDLSDQTTLLRFARTVGARDRLDLLYALTVGDSRATGPAAWNASKAALVLELYRRTEALLGSGVVDTELAVRRRDELRALIGPVADDFLDSMPSSYATAFAPDVMSHHHRLLGDRAAVVEWDDRPDGLLGCTVVAPDRRGLLATVAGALAVLGFDIRSASGYSHRDGVAIEVFAGDDRFGRLVEAEQRADATSSILAAVEGDASLDERLRDRTRRYRAAAHAPDARDVWVYVDLDASESATVVEVHAPDDVGLLARVAAVFADLGLDVSVAIVSTLGDRVVDVFYVRDAAGSKLTDRLAVERLRATLLARLTTEVTLL